MSCINHRKPIPVHADRDGALRYAWLRAPPLRPIPEIPQTFATLDPEPHMRVGKGAFFTRRAHAEMLNVGTRGHVRALPTLRF